MPAQKQRNKPGFPSRTKVCQMCKSEIDVNAIFCPNCGKNPGREQAKALGRLSCAVIQLVFLVPFLLAILWFLWALFTAK